jgi:CRP/FNR family transcriptional regulator
MAIDTEFLQSLPYFAGLSLAELESVKHLVFEKTADRGDIIVLEDEPAEALYFVVSGVVKVLKTSPEGKEQILNIVRPGESFNDVPIFDGQPTPASAEAMSSVGLYAISRTNVDALMRDYPQVTQNVTTMLAARVRQLLALVEDLSFRHVIGRVAKILLEHAGDGAASGPRLTQQDMAAMAGTAREVIGRSLRSLEDDGIIKMDRHKLVITDREALEEMVEAPV